MNKNIIDEFNIIYNTCKDLADDKTRSEINNLFIEELSELIKVLIKLERWKKGDTHLRCSFNEINDNLYEKLSDVIIMILQFSYKKRISHKDLIDKISEKIIKTYKTNSKTSKMG